MLEVTATTMLCKTFAILPCNALYDFVRTGAPLRRSSLQSGRAVGLAWMNCGEGQAITWTCQLVSFVSGQSDELSDIMPRCVWKFLRGAQIRRCRFVRGFDKLPQKP